jgi:hypothetical protein
VKRGKHPTKRHRKTPQRKVKHYMELREELQVAGRIPVEPVGAVRNERVNPASQPDVEIPSLVLTAVRDNWATPASKKPLVVDRLVEMVLSDETKPGTALYAAKVLHEIDKEQHERDHPELKKDSEQGTTQVNVGIDLGFWDRMVQPVKVVGNQVIETNGVADDGSLLHGDARPAEVHRLAVAERAAVRQGS